MSQRAVAIFLAAVLYLSGATVRAQVEADTVILNGKIYTVDAKNRVVEALAVRGGRIVASGSSDDMLARAVAGARVIDLNSRTAVPGLIDAHGHLLNLGRSLQERDLTGTKSYDEVIELVRQSAESMPEEQWIVGRGWDQNDWEDTAFPEHGPLSAVTPRHPVYLTRVDGHAALVNTAAMDIAGITRNTADPPGGKIVRDADGNPTGVLIDRARELVRGHIPAPDPARQRGALGLAMNTCARNGLTSVHDARASAETIELIRDLVDENMVPLRVYLMVNADDEAALEQYFTSGPLIGYGGDRLTVRCIKAVADGALGSRGAALLAPYSDDPENRGLLILDRSEIQSLTERALRAGFQVATHAIGDRANRVALDAYEAAMKAVPEAADPRLRIEHAQIVAPEDIPRFAALGVIPSMQATHATSDMYWAEERVGPQRIVGAYAWRKLIKAGSKIANGSDFPVEGVNPLWGFYASIARRDHEGQPAGGWIPGEVMTREEALRSFTIWAAYAAFEEKDKGSLEPGKLADLTVFSKDIMEIPPEEILTTDVMMTIIGGKQAFVNR